MEGVISIKLLGYSALVSGQEIVQMKITGLLDIDRSIDSVVLHGKHHLK